jgi:hypothetical protein
VPLEQAHDDMGASLFDQGGYNREFVGIPAIDMCTIQIQHIGNTVAISCSILVHFHFLAGLIQ